MENQKSLFDGNLQPPYCHCEMPVTQKNTNICLRCGRQVKEFETTAQKGARLRDEGIKRAEENAGEDWKIEAKKYLHKYVRAARENQSTFKAENIILYAEKMGLPKPPDGRAWGGIIYQAQRQTLIVPTGDYRPSEIPEHHRGPKRVYRAGTIDEITNGLNDE
jgi:hypothetical protein